SQSYNFNVIVSDTGTMASPFVFNSLSNTLVVHAAQIANILTESHTVIDSGQSSILTAGATLGTPGYTFNWFSQASCTGASFATGVTNTVSPIANTVYSFNSVDSAIS